MQSLWWANCESKRKRTYGLHVVYIRQTNNYPPFSSGIVTPDWSGLEPDTPLCPPQKYAATVSKQTLEVFYC